jgi:hypothetical protein
MTNPDGPNFVARQDRRRTFVVVVLVLALAVGGLVYKHRADVRTEECQEWRSWAGGYDLWFERLLSGPTPANPNPSNSDLAFAASFAKTVTLGQPKHPEPSGCEPPWFVGKP